MIACGMMLGGTLSGVGCDPTVTAGVFDFTSPAARYEFSGSRQILHRLEFTSPSKNVGEFSSPVLPPGDAESE